MSEEMRIWQIKHNGVLIPEYKPAGLSVGFRGAEIKLTPEQEEMAVAWVKKMDSEQAKDPVFVKNFFRDFCRALGMEEACGPEDFDFSEVRRFVEESKNISKEEKKRLAEERRRLREENKAKYGYAIINGEKVEIANYMVEPPCIFVGRGKHPLRGRWKPRIRYSDIILNLSEDAPTPPTPTGEPWGGRVFDPSALWIAKWRDKLTEKMKYVWIAENAKLRQMREKEKYDTARRLDEYIERIRKHIWENLKSQDELRRKVATVAYLIDVLRLRVGDEKDKDEADTVGATTLRGSHVKINSDGTVVFDFLGKDSVRWVKKVKLPPEVVDNLRSFIRGSRDHIFDGVRSELVNDFLGEVMPGLTAKVFRTYHATKIVEEYLSRNRVDPEAPEIEKKYVGSLANLEAAIACNHKRKLPKNWRESMLRKEERVRKLKESLELLRRKMAEALKKLEERFRLEKERRERRIQELTERLKNRRKGEIRKRLKAERMKLREAARNYRERKNRLLETYGQRIKRMEEKIRDAEIKLILAKKTRDYNLGTSLKSYIDPRVYASWAKKLGYDWKQLYPKSLHKKFSWVDEELG
jgi:DNA topoisomerase-1